MTRLALLVVLGVVASYYFADSRRVLVDKTKALWTPVVEWNAKQQMREVARAVVDQERVTGRLPDHGDWQRWLDYRYAMDKTKTDPWGTAYGLRVWADSIGVVSYGADRRVGTPDDFMVTERRERLGRSR